MKSPPKNFHPEPFEYHQEVELKIDDLTNLGQGVGRINDWVIFVPFALPGERVLARIWRNKKQYSEADLVEILDPSPDRLKPVCDLFGKCGGCQYQHYSYSRQLEWKQKQIQQLLLKMADLSHPVNPCIGNAEHIYHYRSKITPHFRRPPNIPGTPIGFQMADSRAVIDVAQCPIASVAINEALPGQRKRLQSGEVAYRKGGTLLLRETAGGVLTDMKSVALQSVGCIEFEFIAGEFFQNNPNVLPMMTDYAIERAQGEGIDYLVDTYCGVGVFALCGSSAFESVRGIEVSERAIDLAKSNAERNNISNVSFQLGSAEGIFADLEFPAERTTVLLDPPRRGSDEAFLNQLLKYNPRRIVYVSCGPDTQARDIVTLMAGPYRVVDIQPVDLFPQTRHIENIITLENVNFLSAGDSIQLS